MPNADLFAVAMWFTILFIGLILVVLVVVTLRELSSTITNSNLFWWILLSGAMLMLGILTGFPWWHGIVFMLAWEGTKHALSANEDLAVFFADTPSKAAADIAIGSGAYLVGWIITKFQPRYRPKVVVPV